MNKSIKHKLVYDIWIARSRNRRKFEESKATFDKITDYWKLILLIIAIRDTNEYKNIEMSPKLISELNEKAKLFL